VFWRGLFGGAVITVILMLTQGVAGLRDFGGMGKNGSDLSEIAMVGWINADTAYQGWHLGGFLGISLGFDF
jgi:hypothetical protein